MPARWIDASMQSAVTAHSITAQLDALSSSLDASPDGSRHERESISVIYNAALGQRCDDIVANRVMAFDVQWTPSSHGICTTSLAVF